MQHGSIGRRVTGKLVQGADGLWRETDPGDFDLDSLPTPEEQPETRKSSAIPAEDNSRS
jgi:hypothetical protein